jgi:hypothetical protein
MRHSGSPPAVALAVAVALSAAVAAGTLAPARARAADPAADSPAVAPADPAAPAPAAALAAAAPAPQPGDELSVYVLTMSPGVHPFFKFGHDAILVEDRVAHTELVYNFGTFSFDSPKLALDFMRGRLTYWLSVSSLEQTLATYRADNRTLEALELDLGPAEKLALKNRLELNARPENRSYKYDYFLDNCATRVRDAVDAATGGRLRASAHGPARLTLRGQALRLTADYLPEYLGLYFVLGPSTDRPVDRWGEMFIPQELSRGVRAASLADTADAKDARPLIKAQRLLLQGTRPPPPEQPPERGVTLLLAGLALSLLFVALGEAAARSALPRLLFGLVVAAWGLVTGFLGSFLLAVWAATDHAVVYRNENVLQCAPFALALAVLGFGVAFGMRGATRKALAVATAAAVLAAVGAGMRVAGVSHQDNAPIVGFFVPAWIGLAIGLQSIRRIQTFR